jgi:alpha-amylase
VHLEQEKKAKLTLILALHNHQPEGNLPEVFTRTFAAAYEPFISELENFPGVKVVQHYSGILLNWLRQHRPQFIERLRRLVSTGQAEMMGGAFYEPILVMVPDDDKIGQLEKQQRFIREHFGIEAEGAWLAERVWEPHLAKPLAQAGIRYTVLDDAHFHNIGFSAEDTLHYFVTEEVGHKLFIFPISEKMRYLVPFAEPGEGIAYLRSLVKPGEKRLVVLADDGEKFGSWPGTAERVYRDKWLHNFFNLVMENNDWLKTATFREYLQSTPPKGVVYLPAGSYREMLQWSGGFWRNFFVRYPESNHLHKKMLHVHERVSRLPEGPDKGKAREYLWAGQCNCAYWHGVFGGLYLNFLRSALYSRLIAAEQAADRALYPDGGWMEIERKDFDYDGNEELIINGPDLWLLLSPSGGGAMLELDFKPRHFNLLDVLTRRPEPYHCNIYELTEGHCPPEGVQTIHHIVRVKEPGLQKLLVYDPYRRASLLDHFLQPGTLLADFIREPASVEAGDFIGREYRVIEAKAADGTAMVVLNREGTVYDNGITASVNLTKTVKYAPQGRELSYTYNLGNTGEKGLRSDFGVEFNINFLAGDAPDRYYYSPEQEFTGRCLSSSGEVGPVSRFGMADEWQKIRTEFSFNRPAMLWRMPLLTVSQSEEGLESVYQGSTVIARWPLCLEPGESWTVTINQQLLELPGDVN